MSKYQVIVGNVGTVYDGDDKEQALRDYRECVSISKDSEVGRMAGEQVTLFEDGEILKEHIPS
jgi:hypothetical protein